MGDEPSWELVVDDTAGMRDAHLVEQPRRQFACARTDHVARGTSRSAASSPGGRFEVMVLVCSLVPRVGPRRRPSASARGVGPPQRQAA